MPSRIRYLQGQYHDKSRIVWTSQEVANVAADLLVERDEAQTEGAGNVGAEEDEDEDAPFIHKFVVQVDAGQDRNGDEGAIGNLHECRHERTEAETFDDNGAKIGNAAVWDVAYSYVSNWDRAILAGGRWWTPWITFNVPTTPRKKNK